MPYFKDNQGRSWEVAVNVTSIKRVRELLKVNLLEVVDGALLEQLYRDPILLCDVVYAICKPQADAANVSDSQFGEGLAGDAIEAASQALLDGIVGFFQNRRDRANLQQVLQTASRVMDRARDLVERRIASGALEQAAEQVLRNAIDSFGSSPESSELTQVH